MSVQADSAPASPPDRGFMLGELLVAVFLLVVAISTVSALMYSVTRYPRAHPVEECSNTAKASAKCPAPAKAKAIAAKPRTADRLLFAGCATRRGAEVQECKDSVTASKAPGATTLRSRTDSASLQLLPRKTRQAPRPDLGFVR